MDELIDLIDQERQRLTDKDNNVFAFSFYAVTRYNNFLLYIIERYEKLCVEWENVRSQLHQLANSPNNPQLAFQLFDNNFEIEEEIQLQIESFYLFAKTLLDKLSIAIWQYFGSVQTKGLSLRSNDELTNHLEEYARIKGIIVPIDLLEKAKALRKDVSDFRDWQIAHERNPERKIQWSRMTILDDGKLKLRINRFVSEIETDSIFSRRLDELYKEMSEYVRSVVAMIKNNSDKTTYKLK